MTLATTLTATAERLLTNYGEAITISRKVEGAYDVSTGNTAASTDTTYTGYGSPQRLTHKDADGTTSQDDYLTLWFETGTEPLVGDVATINGDAYRVQQVTQYRIQGQDCLYKLELAI